MALYFTPTSTLEGVGRDVSRCPLWVISGPVRCNYGCPLWAKSGQTRLDDMIWLLIQVDAFGINLVWLNF